jgi:acetone carboxylase gamma subunit
MIYKYGRCKCKAIFTIMKNTKKKWIKCTCGRVMKEVNGKWKLYEAKK